MDVRGGSLANFILLWKNYLRPGIFGAGEIRSVVEGRGAQVPL